MLSSLSFRPCLGEAWKTFGERVRSRAMSSGRGRLDELKGVTPMCGSLPTSVAHIGGWSAPFEPWWGTFTIAVLPAGRRPFSTTARQPTSSDEPTSRSAPRRAAFESELHVQRDRQLVRARVRNRLFGRADCRRERQEPPRQGGAARAQRFDGALSNLSELRASVDDPVCERIFWRRDFPSARLALAQHREDPPHLVDTRTGTSRKNQLASRLEELKKFGAIQRRGAKELRGRTCFEQLACAAMWSSCQCVTTSATTSVSTATPSDRRYSSATGSFVSGFVQESITTHLPPPTGQLCTPRRLARRSRPRVR